MIGEMTKIRRIICGFLAAAACMICTSGTADSHLEIQCLYTDSVSNRALSFDVYEQQQERIIVSTLLPDIAAIEDMNNSSIPITLQEIAQIIHDTDPSIYFRDIKKIISGWINQQDTAVHSGIFSGELFESANELRTCTFTLSGFNEYLNTYSEQNGINKNEVTLFKTMFHIISEKIIQDAGANDLQIVAKLYDNGQYSTFVFMHESMAVLTVSVENVTENETRIVAGYRKEGIYYYRDTDIISEKNSLNITNALYNRSTTFRNSTRNKLPLIREAITYVKEDEKIRFSSRTESIKTSNPLYIHGEIIYGNGNCEVYADAELQESTEIKLSITARLENIIRQVSFDDKRMKNLKNNTDYSEISFTVYSGVIQLVSEIIPSLPEEYQKLLINLLLK